MEVAFVIVAFGLLFFVAKEKEKARKFTKERTEKIHKVVQNVKKEVEMLSSENLSHIKPADIFTQVVEKKYDLQQQLAFIEKEITNCKDQTTEKAMLELHKETLETALEVQNNAMFYVKECISQGINKAQQQGGQKNG